MLRQPARPGRPGPPRREPALARRAGADAARAGRGLARGDLALGDRLDHGTFAGTPCTEYRKDLPLDVVVERGIVAVEFDGGPLPVERGFPARLVVPGYLGTNNVKWLGALTVADRRPEHLFTTHLYLRGGAPVREMDVNSLITASSPVEVAGWAWGFEPVRRVEVAVDDVWSAATVEPRPPGPVTWQRFRAPVTLAPGEHTLAVRATDVVGRTQPGSGARNEVHRITVRLG